MRTLKRKPILKILFHNIKLTFNDENSIKFPFKNPSQLFSSVLLSFQKNSKKNAFQGEMNF